MSITGKQLAEFAVKCFLDGVRYWYGTCYYKCTTALLNSKTRQYPAHYTSAGAAATCPTSRTGPCAATASA